MRSTFGKKNNLDYSVSRNQTSEDKAVEEAILLLVQSAREDTSFRRRVVAFLELNYHDRSTLMDSALKEMIKNGEPASIRKAFTILATEEGALMAKRIIEAQQ